MSVYQTIHGLDHKVDYCTLVRKYGAMPLAASLRRLRVALYVRLRLKASNYLKAIVSAASALRTSWMAEVVDDFRAMSAWRVSRGLSPMSLDMYNEYIASDAKSCYKELHGYINNYKYTIHTRDVSVASATAADAAPFGHVCPECQRSCPNEHILKVHMFAEHGIKHPLRLYFDNTSCFVCMQQFWSRERLLNHLRYKSSRCRNAYLARGPCIAFEESCRSDAADLPAHRMSRQRGGRRHTVEVPAIRLSGPLRSF